MINNGTYIVWGIKGFMKEMKFRLYHYINEMDGHRKWPSKIKYSSKMEY